MSDREINATVRAIESSVSAGTAEAHEDEGKVIATLIQSSPYRKQLIKAFADLMTSSTKSSFLVGLHIGASLDRHAAAVLAEYINRVVLEGDAESLTEVRKSIDALNRAAGGTQA